MFTASCRLGILVFFLSLKDIPLSASAKKKNAWEYTHVHMQHNIISFSEHLKAENYSSTFGQSKDKQCRPKNCLPFRETKHNQPHQLEDTHLQTTGLRLQATSSQSNHLLKAEFPMLSLYNTPPKKSIALEIQFNHSQQLMEFAL